eukprot:6208267-Pleurochrysis_carterae.AAC.6
MHSKSVQSGHAWIHVKPLARTRNVDARKSLIALEALRQRNTALGANSFATCTRAGRNPCQQLLALALPSPPCEFFESQTVRTASKCISLCFQPPISAGVSVLTIEIQAPKCFVDLETFGQRLAAVVAKPPRICDQMVHTHIQARAVQQQHGSCESCMRCRTNSRPSMHVVHRFQGSGAYMRGQGS